MLISVGMWVVPQVGWGPAMGPLLNYGLPGRDPASEPKVGERSGGQHLPHPGEMGAQDRRGLGGSRPSSGRRSGWPNAGLCGILEICSHPGQVFRFHLHLYAPYGSIKPFWDEMGHIILLTINSEAKRPFVLLREEKREQCVIPLLRLPPKLGDMSMKPACAHICVHVWAQETCEALHDCMSHSETGGRGCRRRPE